MTVRENATAIVRRLQSAGYAAYWVGGCVRDERLGREPTDYDIATSARPEQVEALFESTVPVGRQFGVILVVIDGHSFQVATFRAERDYADGRRPGRVEFAHAEADAIRRDFTVNGLFFDPIRGQLHDWVGGRADVEARIIRAIGNPAGRFAEDHLRLLRAVRFAAQLGFEIEPATWDAIRARAATIVAVSAERVRDELLKLFRPPHAARGLGLLRDSGLLAHVLPELLATVTCEQSPDYHPEGTVFQHIRLMLDQLPLNAHESLPWAVLLHDIAKPPTRSLDADGAIHFYGHEKLGAQMAGIILERLRFPRKQIDEIAAVVLRHMQFKDARQMRKSTLRQMLLRPTFELELQLHRLDCLGSHGRLDNHEFLLAQQAELGRQPEIRQPLLRGEDLIALGIQPGPAMGQLLARIREKQLQGELLTADEARRWLQSQPD